LNAIPFLTWWGVTFFTTEHANILSAMIQVVFDNSFSAAAAVEETYFRERLGLDELQSVESRQKTLLKRNLAYQMQNEEEDSDDEEEIPRNVEAIFPYRIFTRIVIGLAKRVMLDRENVLKLRLLLEPSWFVPTKDMEDPKIILERSIDSYYNALRTLLHLAELAVRRLPNNQGTMNLFGRLVHALVCAFVNPPRLDDGENFANFLGLRKTTLDPNRYAERITNATDRKRQQEEIQKNMESASDHLLQSPPPQEVVDVLQSLYRRDQVEIEVSRVGYGDVLCLLGLEISASDALLFYHSYNTVQIYDEDLEEENDDEVLDPSTIVRDEVNTVENLYQITSHIRFSHSTLFHFTRKDGNRLTETQQAARYNFTLTRLLQAWHAPWSPESHQSFQVPFREAARTLFLSAHRIGMPFEIARLVVECCRRDWWEDPVRQCWHTDCQTNKATDVVQDNWLRRMARSLTFGKTCNLVLEEYGTEFISCKCQITQYCSREHQKDDYGEHNHCMQCGKPPFRIPGKEELALCRQVFGEATEDGDEYYGGEMDDDDDDDEGSWETIDSHDENADAEEQLSTTTRIVTQWFEAMKRTRATGDDDEASEESEVGFANGQD
jgi:ribosomal protein S14